MVAEVGGSIPPARAGRSDDFWFGVATFALLFTESLNQFLGESNHGYYCQDH